MDKACAVIKNQSVLEDELDSLKSEVTRINRLSENISDMLRSPQPSCEGTNDKPMARTISGELNAILAVAEETRTQLESIYRLLEEQLGSLKLEH